MTVLPGDWLALLIMVFVLGLKHGMDADHLATIDGITRWNAVSKPGMARWSGVLFSVGHGMVVMTTAAAVGLFARDMEMPRWLDSLGAWISIGFLYLLGSINLVAVFTTPPDRISAPVGLVGRCLGRLTEVSHPVLIAAIGALFALSFDTLSQAALFSLAASSVSGWQFCVVLGASFTLGMVTTDGANGFWIARLVRAADRSAAIASRVMGLTISGLSLLVASCGVTKLMFPGFARLVAGHELAMGLAVVAIVAVSFIASLRLVLVTRNRLSA